LLFDMGFSFGHSQAHLPQVVVSSFSLLFDVGKYDISVYVGQVAVAEVERAQT